MKRIGRGRKRARKIGRPTRSAQPSARKARGAARVVSAGRGREAFVGVVGIGASAGGLDAFRRFFSTVPTESGMAFVLVQHLDPTHESLAAAVIGRYTAMPVVQVGGDMPVKANHVYVIPPGKYLSIGGGSLRLIPPVEPGGIRMSIDLFLRTLAADAGERAIGIILSGTGTDGTLGLQAIKAGGGMSIAQDPATAQYDGMPSSAIAAGAVDHVLPPERMPEALLGFLGHSYVRSGPETPLAAEPARSHLHDILSILRERASFDFRGYKKSTLQRRIHRRMGLRHVERIADYVRLLTSEPAEANALFEDLLIRVTSFFRDPDAWQVLQQDVIRPLVERKEPHTGLRAWVPGCATGEEAYSLGIMLIEAVQTARKSCAVQVFASDVDQGALELARIGLYPEVIAADVTPERLQRFFVPEGHAYRVIKELREAMAFAPQNLVADPPFSRLDLVSCRNLLMYFEPEAQRRILSLLHFAIAEGGYLFLGNAETIDHHAGLFEVVSKKWRIYRRVGPTRHDQVQFPIAPASAASRLPETLPGRPNAGRLAGAIQHLLLERHAPACVVITRKHDILFFSGPTHEYLVQPGGPPTQDLTALTRDGLQGKLRIAVRQAIEQEAPVTLAGAHVRRGGAYHPVRVTVEPLKGSRDTEGLLLVSFADESPGGPPVPPPTAADGEGQEPLVRQLEQELTTTRESLHSTIEELQGANQELRVANEEVMSANEELQSTNEELQTSKEELQSLNEELNTVNAQLGSKVTELEQTNNDLDNLLASANVPTLFLDVHLRVRRFTPNATRLFSLIPSDVGRPIGDITTKYTDADLLPDAEAVLAGLAPVTREVEAHDGRRYVRQVLAYRTPRKRIEGLVVTFSDVAAEALHEARLYSEAIVDTMREPLLVLDADLRVQSANRSFYQTFQLSPDGVMGQPLYEVGGHEWNIPGLRALLGEILPGSAVMTDFEVEHEFAKIGRRTMLLNARILRRAGGRPDLILVAIDDVTERRHAEEALRQSEARARAGVETAVDGIITIDERGTVLSFNPAAEHIFRYAAAEVLGQNVKMLMADGDLASDLTIGEQRLTGIGHEVAGRRKDGTAFPMDLAVSEFNDGVARKFVATVRDITLRKQAEEQLRRRQAELAHVLRIATMERLAAGLAHEINQPLGAIANDVEACAASVRAGKIKPAKLLELLERAGAEALRAGEIVHRLRDFVQRGSPRREPVDLRELVRNATRWLVREMDQEHVALRLQLGVHALPVFADRIQIEQVFVNILQNSIDAIRETGARGQIDVQAGRGVDGVAEVMVNDTGRGLTADAVERLFEPYFTTKARGLGMGLAISRSIIEAHHGQLSLNVLAGRTGATVRVELPLAAPPPR
jgi:two-component system, chemotaxis family, CheB/CheR fusion protein